MSTALDSRGHLTSGHEASKFIDKRVLKRLPAGLLDDDEVVLLAMRPVWGACKFVAIGRAISIFPFVGFLCGLGMNEIFGKEFYEIFARLGFFKMVHPGLQLPITGLVCSVLLVLVSIPFMLGLWRLGWRSTRYVLTNRRIIGLSGVLSHKHNECPLVKIRDVDLTMAWWQRLAGAGSVKFTRESGIEAITWWSLNNPHEVHKYLRTTIRRVQEGSSSQ